MRFLLIINSHWKKFKLHLDIFSLVSSWEGAGATTAVGYCTRQVSIEHRMRGSELSENSLRMAVGSGPYQNRVHFIMKRKKSVTSRQKNNNNNNAVFLILIRMKSGNTEPFSKNSLTEKSWVLFALLQCHASIIFSEIVMILLHLLFSMKE